MTHNPWEATESPSPSASALDYRGRKLPTGFVVCLVLLILFSLGGMLIGCVSIASPFLQDLFPQPPAADAFQRQLNELRVRHTEKMLVPNLVFSGVGLLLSGILFLSSVATIARSAWGLKTLRLTLGIAIAFILIRLVVTLILSLDHFNEIGKLLGEHGADQFAKILLFGAVIFSIIWVVVQSIFYFIVRRSTRSERVLVGFPDDAAQ